MSNDAITPIPDDITKTVEAWFAEFADVHALPGKPDVARMLIAERQRCSALAREKVAYHDTQADKFLDAKEDEYFQRTEHLRAMTVAGSIAHGITIGRRADTAAIAEYEARKMASAKERQPK